MDDYFTTGPKDDDGPADDAGGVSASASGLALAIERLMMRLRGAATPPLKR
jgi:hypothetical protein